MSKFAGLTIRRFHAAVKDSFTQTGIPVTGLQLHPDAIADYVAECIESRRFVADPPCYSGIPLTPDETLHPLEIRVTSARPEYRVVSMTPILSTE